MTREISRHSEIGELLRSQREERGLTLEQAEEVTRIRRRYLEALESGNFAELPGEVYVRGFLRLYAEYLGLDPGAVLAAYTPARRPTQADLIRPPRLDRTHESIGGRLLAIALVALVAVAAFYLYQQQTAGAPSSTGGSSAGTAPSAAGSPAAVAAVTETPQTPTPTPTPTITPTATATPLPSRVMVRVDALGPVGVDAWVDGQLVHSATLQQGDIMRWEGESVRILVADAGNIVLTIDGNHVGLFGQKGERKEFEWVAVARSAEQAAGGPQQDAAPPAGGQ